LIFSSSCVFFPFFSILFKITYECECVRFIECFLKWLLQWRASWAIIFVLTLIFWKQNVSFLLKFFHLGSCHVRNPSDSCWRWFREFVGVFRGQERLVDYCQNLAFYFSTVFGDLSSVGRSYRFCMSHFEYIVWAAMQWVIQKSCGWKGEGEKIKRWSKWCFLANTNSSCVWWDILCCGPINGQGSSSGIFFVPWILLFCGFFLFFLFFSQWWFS
jgi:hypothetical protein